MSKNIDVLRDLATSGKKAEVPFDVEEAIGESWLMRKNEFMVDSVGLAPEERFSKFLERMDGYKFTSSTVDSYHDSWIELFPGTAEQAEVYAKNKLDTELRELPDDASRGDWIQRNLPKVPTKWRGEVAERFQRIREKNANKDYERTRITGVLQAKEEHKKNNKKFLDPDKSTHSHLRSFTNILTAGLIETLDVDDEGDYTALTANGRVKGMTLENNSDPLSSFLSYHDTEQAIRKSMERQQKESAELRRNTTDRATGVLRRNLTKIPREFQANVIVDWATLQNEDEPIAYMRGAIRDVVSKTIEDGKIDSPDELIWEYINIRDEVLNSYLGRNINVPTKSAE
jgi:hypothetical protein